MAIFYFCVYWEVGKFWCGVVDNSNGLYLYDGVVDIICSCLGVFKGVGVFVFICYWLVFIGGYRGGVVICCYWYICIGRVGVLAVF